MDIVPGMILPMLYPVKRKAFSMLPLTSVYGIEILPVLCGLTVTPPGLRNTSTVQTFNYIVAIPKDVNEKRKLSVLMKESLDKIDESRK